MKIIYILFFVLIINNIGYSKDITCNFIVDVDELIEITEGKIFKNKNTTGTICLYGNSDNVSYINIVNGVPHGESKLYYPNGSLFAIGSYSYGLQNGKYVEYYPTGKILSTSFYEHGHKKGISKAFHENGNLKEQCEHKNNYSETCSIYDENKLLKVQLKVVNNKEEYIKLFKYYDHGTIKEILQYQNKKLNGISYSYYPNKKIEKEASFKNDKQDGVTKVYYENGSLMAEAAYKNGKLEGLNKLYYKNGKIQVDGNFKNDKAEGPAKFYYENGKLNFTLINKRGKPISGKCANGREISKKELKEFMKGTEIKC